jgi:hypothetical protein
LRKPREPIHAAVPSGLLHNAIRKIAQTTRLLAKRAKEICPVTCGFKFSNVANHQAWNIVQRAARRPDLKLSYERIARSDFSFRFRISSNCGETCALNPLLSSQPRVPT